MIHAECRRLKSRPHPTPPPGPLLPAEHTMGTRQNEDLSAKIMSKEVEHRATDACVPPQAQCEPALPHTIQFIQRFIHSSSLSLSFPSSSASSPPSGCRWRSEQRGGEGRQEMIMQQAAVLHPDAVRHTRLFSSFSRAAAAPEHTQHAGRHAHTHTQLLNAPTPTQHTHTMKHKR